MWQLLLVVLSGQTKHAHVSWIAWSCLQTLEISRIAHKLVSYIPETIALFRCRCAWL